MTDALVQFLRARLDEDKSAARAAALQIAERAVAPAYAAEHVDRAGQWVVRPWLYSGRVEPSMGMSGPDRVEIATVANDHIARHDPARVLREVEAKQRIINRHSPAPGADGQAHDTTICDSCSAYDREDGVQVGQQYPCDTIRLLALPYADHPDYRPEWASDQA